MEDVMDEEITPPSMAEARFSHQATEGPAPREVDEQPHLPTVEVPDAIQTMHTMLANQGMTNVEFIYSAAAGEAPVGFSYRKPGHERCYLWQPSEQHGPSPTECIARLQPVRVTISPVQGEARTGLLVLVPSEGAQQPLQQALEDQNGERCHLRFKTATAGDIKWVVARQPSTEAAATEDFAVECTRFERPHTPRDPPVSERILRHREQEALAAQLAACTMEDSSKDAAVSEAPISSTASASAAAAPTHDAAPSSPIPANPEAPTFGTEPTSPACTTAPQSEQPLGVAQAQAETHVAASLLEDPSAECDEVLPGAVGKWICHDVSSGSEESC